MHIKEYIADNDNQIMTTYLAGIANDVYAVAQNDFDEAADKYDLEVVKVSNVAENPGSSQFIASFNYSDYTGLLANAAADSDFENKLFSAEDESVLEPVLSGTSYIVVRPTASNGTNYIANYVSAMYSSYAGQLSLSDLQNSILSSDKLHNDFYTVYLQKIMGLGTN